MDSPWLVAALVAIGLYALFVAGLAVAGRGPEARAIARLVPDCLVLARGLLGDREVPAVCKLALIGLLAYLISPIDLVPDFVPVVGVLDDAILVALTLRWIMRTAGPHRVTRHWRGTPRGLQLVLRATYRPGG
ncbi:MAG TPA: DUF1232 domain-containing protein [Solirubrobacteraceae bacterium]|nr:DUF1232 domain-containing protein [Solirubrobacteraceae bacterium]